jgi:predicted nucleic acid-binding protein
VKRVYLDASALVKLGIVEPESAALRGELRNASVLHTSVIGQVEFERAIRRAGLVDPEAVIDPIRRSLDVVPLHVAIAGAAGALRPLGLRALDAVHLATMLALQGEFEAAYVYDDRLANAAMSHGIEVRAPA